MFHVFHAFQGARAMWALGLRLCRMSDRIPPRFKGHFDRADVPPDWSQREWYQKKTTIVSEPKYTYPA